MPDTTTLTVQDALLTLQKFWTDRGCMIVQPFNTEVGAGTMNPATILRVLGPEPWRVAYVEPSVRPDDSRYGENPNRSRNHTQFQVILKPDPGNPQELYLESLEALGIDIRGSRHPLRRGQLGRPAIGAWGLGWEVWLDGMEITQFTYFQQVGGQNLDPVSVEMTYGIERIMMALQGVTHFKDMEYAPGISYGEAFGQSEYEMSRYYLDDADIADATATSSSATRPRRNGSSTRACRSPRTTSSSRRTPSTSSTHAARSRRPSAPRRRHDAPARARGVPPLGGAARGARLPAARRRPAADGRSSGHATFPWG